jgi:hypothetical protein
MLNAPLFIGGAGRSGTTLLADLMGCHPEISPVYETDFLRDFVLLFCVPDSPPLGVACKKALLYMNKWSQSLPHRPHNKGQHEHYVHGPHYLLFDRELVLQTTLACIQAIQAGNNPHNAIGRMATRLFDAHAAKDNKPRWINKTPANLAILPELAQAFGPELRFVHILRDPRDVACSVVDRPWGPQNHGDVGAWWAGKISRGLQFAQNNNIAYMEVHFEELVRNPAPVLNRLFAFVGEAPLGKQVAKRHAEGRIPFDLSRIGRWRSEFPADERQAFLRHCGPLMEHVGYGWATAA